MADNHSTNNDKPSPFSDNGEKYLAGAIALAAVLVIAFFSVYAIGSWTSVMPVGATGATGATGDIGARGVKGPRGPQGPNGRGGDRGPQGESGMPGQDACLPGVPDTALAQQICNIYGSSYGF